jgi:hypothetical protein
MGPYSPPPSCRACGGVHHFLSARNADADYRGSATMSLLNHGTHDLRGWLKASHAGVCQLLIVRRCVVGDRVARLILECIPSRW